MTAKGIGTNSIGAANEDMFLKAFDSTPKIELTVSKKLDIELSKCISIISNPSADWDSRVQAIKHFRSLVNSGIAELNDDFHTTTLKTLEVPFQNNICDLRSQVVRETCITIAFLSCRLQQKFARMAEVLLTPLIKLIPNSAKIISTSALVALRFIIQSTHSSRFIPIIKYQLSTSKAKDINRALCEIVERIVTLWPPQFIERQLNDFQECLRLGIGNSDEMARQYARRAFNVFAEHFHEPADRLYNSLDQRLQRMLNNLNHGGGSTMSINGYGSQSSNIHLAGQPTSLIYQPQTHHHAPNLAHSTGTSQQTNGSSIATSNNSSNTLMSRIKGPMSHAHAPPPTTYNSPLGTSQGASRIRTPTARSTSAIDVSAQKRARARAVYLSSMHHQPRQLGAYGHLTPSKVIIPNHKLTPVASSLNHHQPTTPSAIPSLTSPSAQSILTSTEQTPKSNQIYTASNNNNINNNNHYQTKSTLQSPNVAQQQQQLIQLQQKHAASAEKKDGIALINAASYLKTVIQNQSMAESQIVTTIKYFNSLIDKHPPEIISQHLHELMPPLVVGIDNAAICVRKASVFAMVAIHSKVGLKEMENYISGLTMTQRKLLDVYIKKSKETS